MSDSKKLSRSKKSAWGLGALADASLELPDGITLVGETASGIECIALPGVYRLSTSKLGVAQS